MVSSDLNEPDPAGSPSPRTPEPSASPSQASELTAPGETERPPPGADRRYVWLGTLAIAMFAVLWGSTRCRSNDTVAQPGIKGDGPRAGEAIAANEAARPRSTGEREQGGVHAPLSHSELDGGSTGTADASSEAETEGLDAVDTAALARPDAEAEAPGLAPTLSRSATKATRSRSHEAGMNADQLVRAAEQAYDAGDGPQAYRMATLSYAQSPSDSARELKVKSACLMKNKPAAKAAFGSLPRDRRRDVRKACRAHGVGLGVG